jgi:hypothetical protein
MIVDFKAHIEFKANYVKRSEQSDEDAFDDAHKKVAEAIKDMIETRLNGKVIDIELK